MRTNLALLFGSLWVLGCNETPVNPIPPTDFHVHFQYGFINDSVSIQIDSTVLYSAQISTNEDSIFAASWSTALPPGTHMLSIRIPGSAVSSDSLIQIDLVPVYVTVAYSRANGKLYIRTSNQSPEYRARVLKQKLFFSSFLSGSAQNIFMMDVDGGEMTQLTHYLHGEYRGPRISPDGRRLLYYRFDGEDGGGTLQNGIFIKDLFEPDPEGWLDYGISCNFSPDGVTIVYTNRGIRSLRLSDRTITQITSNSYNSDGYPTKIDWSPSYSPDGLKIVFNSWSPIDQSDTLVFSHWDVMLMDRDGSNIRTLVRQRRQWCNDPIFYPDGNRVLFTRHAGNGEYFISAMNLTDSTWHDIARTPSHSQKVSFNPDGSRVYFQSGYPAENIDLYWVSSSGGLCWKVFGNQVADTDPLVQSAWVYE